MSGHDVRGRVVRLRTHELQRAATGVLVWAERAGVELRALDVRPASLEEAFLGIAREASGAGASGPGSGAASGAGAGSGSGAGAGSGSGPGSDRDEERVV